MEKSVKGIFSRVFPASLVCSSLLIIGLASNPAYATPGYKPPPCDRVTGGGFIYTSAGAKAHFNVNFGRNAKNELFAQVSFNDSGVGGPKIKAERITSYTRVGTDPGKRRVTGIASNKSDKGSPTLGFEVVVDDNGEPGRADTFFIRLEGGYTASGLLAGGNIQFHNQCRPSGGPNRF